MQVYTGLRKTKTKTKLLHWYTHINIGNKMKQCLLHCVVSLPTRSGTHIPTSSPLIATTSTHHTGHRHTIARVGKNRFLVQISAWQVRLRWCDCYLRLSQVISQAITIGKIKSLCWLIHLPNTSPTTVTVSTPHILNKQAIMLLSI